jgi:radical SAM enzyme (TIGR04100 family)
LTILYAVKGNLYINITNRCPCACTFCIRQNGDGAYGSDSLWLEREPTVDEVKSELDKIENISQYGEIVFCGYGEPMERAEDVAEIGRYIKSKWNIKVRLNTNGLGDKINSKPTAPMLKGAVDTVSVSLNSGNKESYNAVTRPKWDDSFEAMLAFAAECKKYVKKVIFTIVDVIPKEEIEQCREISRKTGIELRIRAYDS